MAQNFLQPGFDLSSLTSVTQAQLMQALSQMEPIGNIGFVIWQSTTPSVADNPIFARCIWADTSAGVGNTVLKYWNGSDWVVGTVAVGSIDNPDSIVDGTITIIKMDGSEGAPGQVARIKTPGGGSLQYVDPAALFSGTGELNVNNLAATALQNDYFLRVQNGVATWVAYNPSQDLSNVSPSVLQAGAYNSLLVTTASGNREWTKTPLSNINNSGEASDVLNLSKLNANGLSSGAVPKVSGGVWAGSTPSIDIFNTTKYVDALATLTFNAINTVTTVFTAIPRYWKVVIRCEIAESDWVVGDELELNFCVLNVTPYNLMHAFIDGTSFAVKVSISSASPYLRAKTTTGAAAMTAVNWRFRCYYIY